MEISFHSTEFEITQSLDSLKKHAQIAGNPVHTHEMYEFVSKTLFLFVTWSTILFIYQVDIKGLLVLHLMLFKIALRVLTLSSSVL